MKSIFFRIEKLRLSVIILELNNKCLSIFTSLRIHKCLSTFVIELGVRDHYVHLMLSTVDLNNSGSVQIAKVYWVIVWPGREFYGEVV